MLEFTAVSKHFGGLFAVRDVSLACEQREILGLIGPNGAGKTTLLNLATGILRPDSGTIRLEGRRLEGMSPQFCARAGVARTFQNIRLFGHLTVRQNVEVAATSSERSRRAGTHVVDVDRLLASMDLADLAQRPAPTLAYGHQRRLEIARALALAPKVLLLDEPAAGMNRKESNELIGSVRSIRDQYDCGIIVIGHDLRFIMNVCERIAVLHMGELIALGSPTEVRNDPRVIDVYVGEGSSEAA